mgnify:CR=1 FL=1
MTEVREIFTTQNVRRSDKFCNGSFLITGNEITEKISESQEGIASMTSLMPSFTYTMSHEIAL